MCKPLLWAYSPQWWFFPQSNSQPLSSSRAHAASRAAGSLFLCKEQSRNPPRKHKERFHLHRQQHGPHHRIHSSYKTLIPPVGGVKHESKVLQRSHTQWRTHSKQKGKRRHLQGGLSCGDVHRSQLHHGSPQLRHPPWLQHQEEQGKCMLGCKRHPSCCFSGNSSEKAYDCTWSSQL